MSVPARPAADSDAIRQHTLKSLALNREPGWNFPGNFLDLSFDEVAPPEVRISMDDGPHCRDAAGQVHLAALCVLADVGLASVTRHVLGRSARMATVSLTLLFTGAPRRGRLALQARFDGLMQGTRVPQALSRAEIRGADGALVCSGVGTFLSLGEREGLTALPMRTREASARVPALEGDALDEVEHAILARAEAALAAPAPVSTAEAPHGAFLDRFWTLVPERTPTGATCRFENGPHAGNRVGHTQGGISCALAALTANAALGAGWQLAGCTAAYLAPGTGGGLNAQATVVHQGGLTAGVRIELRDDAGRLVLDTITQHIRVA